MLLRTLFCSFLNASCIYTAATNAVEFRRLPNTYDPRVLEYVLPVPVSNERIVGHIA